jgi:hypothetical protein
MQQWWDAVKGFRFGGWALAGDTGWRGGIEAVLRQILMMRDEGAFLDGMEWLHVLGVSQAKWAVLLTAVQRGIRHQCNPAFRVSYDSASANILSGVYQQVAIYPKYTSKAESWTISAARCPNDKVYVSGNPVYPFPFPSPIGDVLKMHHLNVFDEVYSAKRFDDVSHHLLTNHNMWVYVRAMLEANELAFLDEHDARRFVPPKLLECIYLVEELIAGGAKWKSAMKKNAALFEAVDAMRNDDAATASEAALLKALAAQ